MGLSWVPLQGTNLFGALLADAKFVGADMTGADLESAVLDNADLSNAVLVGAQVGAKLFRWHCVLMLDRAQRKIVRWVSKAVGAKLGYAGLRDTVLGGQQVGEEVCCFL